MSDQVSSLESEIEQTRERLGATIDQLAYRASPKTIIRREIASVKAHFVDPSGQPRTDNILKVVGGVAGVVALGWSCARSLPDRPDRPTRPATSARPARRRLTRPVPGRRRCPASAGAGIGSRIRNVVPTPGVDSKSALPWCASAIDRTMCRPSPVPWMACSVARVERKNRWNSRLCSSSGMPIPVSLTRSCATSGPGGDVDVHAATLGGELHGVADQVEHETFEVGGVALEHHRHSVGAPCSGAPEAGRPGRLHARRGGHAAGVVPRSWSTLLLLAGVALEPGAAGYLAQADAHRDAVRAVRTRWCRSSPRARGSRCSALSVSEPACRPPRRCSVKGTLGVLAALTLAATTVPQDVPGRPAPTADARPDRADHGLHAALPRRRSRPSWAG